MLGVVKSVFREKGFGFIVVRHHPRDIFFRLSQCVSGSLNPGDEVEVEAFVSAPGKTTARTVVLVRSVGPLSKQRPYYAKPTMVKDGIGASGRSVLGLVAGSLLGPVGAVVGALIGAGMSDGSRLLTQACLRCGGVGNVTVITPEHVGFQCISCKSFWKMRNKNNLQTVVSDDKRDGR